MSRNILKEKSSNYGKECFKDSDSIKSTLIIQVKVVIVRINSIKRSKNEKLYYRYY